MYAHSMPWLLVVIGLVLVLFWIASTKTPSFVVPERGDLLPFLLDARRVTQQRPSDASDVRWAVQTVT